MIEHDSNTNDDQRGNIQSYLIMDQIYVFSLCLINLFLNFHEIYRKKYKYKVYNTMMEVKRNDIRENEWKFITQQCYVACVMKNV